MAVDVQQLKSCIGNVADADQKAGSLRSNLVQVLQDLITKYGLKYPDTRPAARSVFTAYLKDEFVPSVMGTTWDNVCSVSNPETDTNQKFRDILTDALYVVIHMITTRSICDENGETSTDIHVIVGQNPDGSAVKYSGQIWAKKTVRPISERENAVPVDHLAFSKILSYAKDSFKNERTMETDAHSDYHKALAVVIEHCLKYPDPNEVKKDGTRATSDEELAVEGTAWRLLDDRSEKISQDIVDRGANAFAEIAAE
jgi:hypothetical protein